MNRRMRVALSATGTMAVLGLIFVDAAAGSTAVAARTTQLKATHAQAASIAIHPMVSSRLASVSQPPSEADCVSSFTVPCYDPAQLRQAYNEKPLFNHGITGKGETIVIVDAFGSPTIRADLGIFDAQFGLPAPPSFKIIQPAGAVPPYDPTDANGDVGWAGETTLDVEWSHTIAPGANILLVETPVAETEGVAGFPQIIRAENYVINHHLGDVISQSFAATEQTFPSADSIKSLRSAYLNAFHHGVTVLAASGDTGAASYSNTAGTLFYTHPAVNWPSGDPLVTGLGGTQLRLNASGHRTAQDRVWNDSYNQPLQDVFFGNTGPNPLATGGGKSVVFSRPWYQNGVADVTGSQRGVPDISMSGACSGLVDTYDGYAGEPAGWYVTCGTSEASPLFAGIVALADQVAGHSLGLINPALYAMAADHAPGIVDITKGNNTVGFTQNGHFYTVHGYPAGPGYDLASGLGTVDAARFVPELAWAASHH